MMGEQTLGHSIHREAEGVCVDGWKARTEVCEM